MAHDECLPLHIDWWWKSFGYIGAPLSRGGHDGFALRLELINEVVHLFPFGAQFKSLTGSTWSRRKNETPYLNIPPLTQHQITENILTCFPELYLTGAGVIFGFSGSTIVSVMMDPEETLVMPALPKPPKAGTFLPERSASLLACCSSLAFLLISALASLS